MTKVIEGDYLRDLLEQPHALDSAVQALADGPEMRDLARSLERGGVHDRVVLTGMGSSLYALYPLHLKLLAHNLPSIHVETSELIHFQGRMITPRTLIIAVSQSGRSGEMLGLLEMIGDPRQVIAITNDPGSPLAEKSAVRLFLNAGPESTVSCKTYVSTLLMLDWLGAILTAENLGAVRSELSAAGSAVAQYLGGWRAHVEEFSEALTGISQVYLTGRGRSLATALTGGLILKESTRTACEGMSSAAFRHGPFEVLSPEVLVMVMAGDGPVVSLNRRLAADIARVGARAICVDSAGSPPMALLPRAPERLRSILEILPVQMLSLAIAARKGEEAGRFHLASKITATQ